ncbi:MAG: type II secretion system protein [Butyricicoccus sp.]
MMEKMIALQQKRRSKKGGFTLVELIVVLVILAILAALLSPALTGYIDRAKEKSITAETRQVVMAAQTLYDEAYGSSDTAPTFSASATIKYSDVKNLAEVKGTITTITVGASNATDDSANKITSVVYTNSGKTCTYNQSTGKYTVTNSTK